MSFTIFAAALLAQATGASFTHSVTAMPGSTVAATYEARPVVTTRQIGTAAGTRMGTMRCTWKADINVVRRLEPGDASAPARALMPVKTLSGSRHGDCFSGRRAIDQEVASRAPEIRAHLEAVAMQDQRDLRVELESFVPTSGR